MGDSIGYIYVYMRGKVDAGERRRRLLEERAGAETLLAGAISEVGLAVLREGIQHPEITGLLEAVGRAHARREGAAADARRVGGVAASGGSAAGGAGGARGGGLDRRRQGQPRRRGDPA